MKAKQHGSQHYVPRTYLKGWCDPDTPDGMDPYVWVFDRSGRNGRRKAPKNLFEETDFYTIHMPDGTRDLVLEHGLQGLEDSFAKLRDEKLTTETPVSSEEGALLFAFVVAMSFRTAAHRQRRRAQWQRVVEVMEQAQKKAPTDALGRTPTIRFSTRADPKYPSLSVEEVRGLAEQPMQHMLIVEMSTYLPLVAGMDMMVMRTDDPVGFITSDDPCIWINERIHDGPPVTQKLGEFGILMPLSPQRMLFLNQTESGYGRLESIALVNEHNRMSRRHAYRHIIVNKNETRPEWFSES